MSNIDPRDAPRRRRHREELREQIRQIRSQGYFAGYDVFLKGVGAICLPVPPSMAPVPLVLAVAGGKDRVQPQEKAILRALRNQLRQA